MTTSLNRGVSHSRMRTLVLLSTGIGVAMAIALAVHGGSASATGASPTISAVNGGSPVAATGAKVILPITGENFVNPKVTITGSTGDVKVLGLAAGTSSTQLNVIVHLPTSSAAAGTKVVTVKNRKAGSTSSSLIVDEAPVVTSVAPSSLYKGGSETLTITGSHFHVGATLLPLRDVVLTDISRVNATTITATATVKAKPSGSKRVVQVSNPNDGGYSSSVASSGNRLTFASLPSVGGYFYFGQSSATVDVTINGLPTSSGTLRGISFGDNAASTFDLAAWNAAPSASIAGTLAFDQDAAPGPRSLDLTFSSGLTIHNPRAVYINPAPTLSGFNDGTSQSFPVVVDDSGQLAQIMVVGSGFQATNRSGLVPTATVSGTATGVSVVPNFGANQDQTTAYIDPGHLYVALSATTCTSGSDSLTITNPTQPGSAKIPGVVGGSVTYPDAIEVNCLPPEITSVSPNPVPDDSTAHLITVVGSQFDATSVLSIADTSFATATIGTTTFIDSSHLTAEVTGTPGGPLSTGPIDLTVTNGDGGTSTLTDAFEMGIPPTITSISLSGTPTIGTGVSVSDTETGDPIGDVSYQWYRCTHAVTEHLNRATIPSGCTAITGETADTYTPTSTDTNKYVTVTVTVVNPFGADQVGIAASASRTNIEPSLSSLFVASAGADRLAGFTTVGYPTPTTSIQWYDCASELTTEDLTSSTPPGDCTAISGATAERYTPQATDAGSFLAFSVTAANGVGTDAGAVSPSTSDVVAGSVGISQISISGTPSVGATLTSTVGVYGGPVVDSEIYVWYLCPSAVTQDLSSGGAPVGCTATDVTSASYPITNSTDAGKYLVLDVQASNGVTSAEGYSSSTAIVTGPVGISQISISGTPADGVTLTSTVGTYGGPAVSSTTYEWFLCPSAVTADLSSGGAPDGCTTTGVTTASYTVNASTDGGQYLVLDVQVANGTTSAEGYSSSTDMVTPLLAITSLDVPTLPSIGDSISPNAVTVGDPEPTVTYVWYLCASQPANTLSVGSGGVAAYLASSSCTAITTASTNSTYDTSSNSAGDFLAVVATAVQAGGATTSAVSGIELQAA